MEDKILKELCQTLLDNKGTEVVYFDVEKVNPLASYYIICSANSNRHALALGHYCDDTLAKYGIFVKHIEGNETSDWILVDGIDYIIHIFVNEARERYGLEKMWAELDIYKVEDRDDPNENNYFTTN